MRSALFFLFVLLGVLTAGQAAAQTVDTYQPRYFLVGASEPFQVADAFPASQAICNQADPGAVSSVNPTRLIWDDVDNPGRVCIFQVPAGGSLPSLPLGNYEGSLVAVNAAGSAESARVSFTRRGPPRAPTGLRFVR